MAPLPAVPRAFTPWCLLSACAALLPLGACKFSPEQVEPKEPYFKEPPEVVLEVHRNQLGDAPTHFLQSRASDSIPWQPWNAELFEHARLEQKPIFALVVGGGYPLSISLLDRLASDVDRTRALSDNYICTLIDIQAHPELAIYSATLARELPRAPGIPTMVWFSHELNPVAWLPLTFQDVQNLDEVIGRSHAMVRHMWKDDSSYVVANSMTNNNERIARVSKRLSKAATWELNYRGRRHRAGQTLSSYYDPVSRSIDGIGRDVPFSLLQFAANLASDPATVEWLRNRLIDLVKGNTDLLLESSLRDPLDGGFFHARLTTRSTVPSFLKDCATQLDAILTLTALARLINDDRYLREAYSVLNFTTARFMLDDRSGLAAFETSPTSLEEIGRAYLWSSEELRTLLTPEQFRVVEHCYDIKSIGNIPLEADPRRRLMGLNSLRARHSPAEAAAPLGLSPDRARDLLAAARRLLWQRRAQRLPGGPNSLEATVTTELNARFVATLAELSAASDDEALLVRAREVLQELRRSHYSERGGLLRIAPNVQRKGVPARGIDYAILLDALFRLYRLDLDPAHLVWAVQLADEAFEKLAGQNGLLAEAPVDDRILTVPLHNITMAFGLSTWGVLHGPLKRLHQLTGSESIQSTLRAHAGRLAPKLLRNPLMHTDFADGCSVTQRDTLVCLDGPRESPDLEALHRVLLEPAHTGVTVVHLSPALPGAFDLPPPGHRVRALVRRGGVVAGVAGSPAELRVLLDVGASAE